LYNISIDETESVAPSSNSIQFFIVYKGDKFI